MDAQLPSSQLSDEQLAWHEAGHVVWAWIQGVRILSCTIEGGFEDDGQEYFGRTIPEPGDSTHPDQALYHIAGLTGEIIGAEKHGYLVGDLSLQNDSQRSAWHLLQQEQAFRHVPISEAEGILARAVGLMQTVSPALETDCRMQAVVDALIAERTLEFVRLEELRGLACNSGPEGSVK